MDEKKPLHVFGSSDDIQAKLDKKLGPEYISKRVGFGSSRVAYIEGWRAINLANQIFGYNGWSTEVKNVIIDFLDERQGKFFIGCTAIVRVTLENGTFREDIGYGTVENERRKAAAFERAKKSAVTDALKRALRAFGNALGNCLYDKDFLAKIDKIKFDPPDFDENNLFRPSDEISEISRSGTIDHDQTSSNNNNFNSSNYPNKRRHVENSHSKLAMIKKENNTSTSTNNPTSNSASTSNKNTIKSSKQNQDKIVDNNNGKGMTIQEQEDLLDDSLMFSDDLQDEDINPGKAPATTFATTNNDDILPSSDPATFVTAKGATSLQNKDKLSDEIVFDPKYQAQSIKHTIDQTTSKHIPASAVKDANSSRDNLYDKFAPKGKGLSTTTEGANTSNPKNSIQKSDTTTGKPEPGENTDPSRHSAMAVSKPKETSDPNGITGDTPPASHALLSTTSNNNKNRFAPPSSVVHPNSYLPPPNPTSAQSKGNSSIHPNSIRREIGRPKVNPLSLRKTNP